jgi:hypothetical protein
VATGSGNAMFKRLSALFGARKEQLSSQAEMTKDRLVEAFAKSQGLVLSPKPAPSPTHGKLTPTQFRAFECAYEALLERMVKGASGLVPDFRELESKAISHITTAGWVQSASASSELSLAARATVAMLTYDHHMIFASFGDIHMARNTEIGAFRQAHGQALDRLRTADGAEETVVRQHLFAHPACADAFVHLYWRDVRRRTETYFDIVLGFGTPFAEATTEAMLADIVFQTFRRSFASYCSFDRLVIGGMWLGGRDGIGTRITGLVLSDRTFEHLAGEGLFLPPCLLCLSLHERML